MSPVTLTLSDGVAVLAIDNPPVNAASHAVREGLVAALDRAIADPAVVALVIAAEGRTFVAGADITEFGKPSREPSLPALVNRIEAAAKPIVVAWHGTALGGGCEIGLAAHARIMAATGRVGLPEVKLGLVPGAGGTQRLPRLVGTARAIDLVTSGRMADAAEALAIGLVDRVAEGDLRAEAVALARSLAGTSPRRTGDLPVPAIDEVEVERQAGATRKRARGQLAPEEGIRLVRLAAGSSLSDGLAEERAAFARLLAGPQSRALRHVFFAEREASRVPGLEGVKPRDVRTVGVIGAGTMGSGIALAFLDKGFRVIIVETSPDALAAGQGRVAGLLDRSVASGRIAPATKAERLSAARFTTDLAELAAADLVVEAVYEDMAVKLDLFRRLEPVLRPDAVIATNTSYLDVNAMGDALERPAHLVGLHFFSPAHVMKLLEVVRARRTAPEVLATALALGRKLGKTTVVAGVCDGFIGNRILARYRAECEAMLDDGALPQEVDAAFEAFGFPMGPFAMSDLAGLDIAWARRKRLAAAQPAAERVVSVADQLCALGRFGQKTGAGWYRYEAGKRTVDPVVDELVGRHAREAGRPGDVLTGEGIMARVLAAMADEGVKILDEGIAIRPGDIDVVMINGYGFPAHRGGPMYLAEPAS